MFGKSGGHYYIYVSLIRKYISNICDAICGVIDTSYGIFVFNALQDVYMLFN